HVNWWRHFEAPEKRPWVDIIEFADTGSAAKAFADGGRTHTGMPSQGFFLFLTYGAPEGRSAICTLVQKERWLFNVCAAAPFVVAFDKNSAEERRQLAGWIDLVTKTLEGIMRQAIDPKVVTYVPTASPAAEEVRMLRIAGFSRLWSEVRQNFVFLDQRPDLDWETVLERYMPEVAAAKSQGEYIAILRRVIALLHDGHSGIMASDDRESPAVRVESVEGKPVVTATAAAVTDVKPGMEIVAV